MVLLDSELLRMTQKPEILNFRSSDNLMLRLLSLSEFSENNVQIQN